MKKVINMVTNLIGVIKHTTAFILYNPKLDTRISFVRSSVTLVLPPLDSETGWTGELWSKTNLLNW